MARETPYPNDPTLGIFGRVVDFATTNTLTRPVVKLLNITFFAISPAVPATFCDTLRAKTTRRALWWGFGITFLCCFVTVLAWTLADGTFSGADRTRIYFSHDLTNIINFAVICPAYVGLAAQLVVLLVACWGKLSSPSGITPVGVDSRRLPHASIGLTVIIIFGTSAASTVNYIRECLDPNVYPQIGWWVGRVTADGSRILSPLGIYYAILMFVLLSICVIAALAFLSLFFLCIRFGVLVGNQPLSSELDFDSLRTTLSHFTQAYIVFKMLAVVLIMNAFTWKYQGMHSSLNFLAMTTGLVFFGVFFISIPRYYIELEWFRFRVNRARAAGDRDDLERDDIRPSWVRLTSQVCDYVIFSLFLGSWFTWLGEFWRSR